LALPRRSIPHVELLCYCGDFGERINAQGINDRTATRLVFEVDGAEQLADLCERHTKSVLSGPVTFADGSSRAMLRDPDGHLICLEAARRAQSQPPVANPG
jgi:predicted enzyme related to lactoylglutathione lyase